MPRLSRPALTPEAKAERARLHEEKRRKDRDKHTAWRNRYADYRDFTRRVAEGGFTSLEAVQEAARKITLKT